MQSTRFTEWTLCSSCEGDTVLSSCALCACLRPCLPTSSSVTPYCEQVCCNPEKAGNVLSGSCQGTFWLRSCQQPCAVSGTLNSGTFATVSSPKKSIDLAVSIVASSPEVGLLSKATRSLGRYQLLWKPYYSDFKSRDSREKAAWASALERLAQQPWIKEKYGPRECVVEWKQVCGLLLPIPSGCLERE